MKYKLITLLALLSIAGCDLIQLPDSATVKDSVNPTIEILTRGGIINTHEYLSIEYSDTKNVLLVCGGSDTISYPINDVYRFTTSQTAQTIQIYVWGEGLVIKPYNQIEYSDRNVLTITYGQSVEAYAVEQFKNYKTYE